jgi:hypothetical protein
MNQNIPDLAKERRHGILEQIRLLERELVRETLLQEKEFCYRVHEQKVRFTAEAKVRHRKLAQGLHHFLRTSRLMVLVTAPVIWMCLVPILFVDLIGSFYQAICFPIYGIPKVRRRDYLAFDRHHLGYLNFIEKLNCEYCAYANGILAYFTEIAARTEQYWCPIKHAQCVKCAHSRYGHFIDFGDAEKYRSQLEAIRREYGDLGEPVPGNASSPPAGP